MRTWLFNFIQDIFKGLIELSYDRMLASFERIPFWLRWNVAKNLLYFSLKFSLLATAAQAFSIDLLRSSESDVDSDESLHFLLFSILSYIESFKFVV